MKRRVVFLLLPATVTLVMAVWMRRGWWGMPNGATVLFDLSIEHSVFVTVCGVVWVLLGGAWLVGWWQGAGQQVLWQQKALAFQKQLGTWQAQAVERRLLYLQAINHELQNPLHIIQSTVAQTNGVVMGDGSLHKVRRQAERLERLLMGVRKLVEIQVEEMEQRWVDVAELLLGVVAEINGRFANQERIIQLDLPADDQLAVVGDEDLLTLALFNLIENALKYTTLHDKIMVRAFVEEDELVIQVLDQGRGIPDADMADIHKAARRGSNVGQTLGSGLGLMFVHTVVERHLGEMLIRSIEEVGTRVTLRLPLAAG